MQLCRTPTPEPHILIASILHRTYIPTIRQPGRQHAASAISQASIPQSTHTDKERYHAASPSPSDESGLQALQGEAGPIRSAPLLPAHRSINFRALHMYIPTYICPYLYAHTYICTQTAQRKWHFPPFLFQNPHSCTRATTVSPSPTHTSYARSRGRSAVVCANGRARGRRRTT